MMVFDLVRGRKVFSVSENENALSAARFMAENNVGAVAVLRDGELVGMFSERDVLNRIIAAGRDPAATTVRDVMTANPWVVPPDEDVYNCMRLMKQQGFRHLPICEGKRVIGVVSLRDLLLFEVDEMEDEVRHMRAYIHAAG